MKKFLLIIAAAFSFSSLIPNLAFAEVNETIYSTVECGKGAGGAVDECGFNDLITLIQNLINYAIMYLIMPLVVLVILYHGARMMFVAQKPAELTAAKAALTKVVIGLFFMLCAWLIMNLVIDTFITNYSDDPSQGPVRLLNT